MASRIKVKREMMRACLSCPLCDNLLCDSTTISECLHTFCRKCIYEKITEDEIERCPVCNIDLGGSPLEKLRPDHNMQDLRVKIFPPKRIQAKDPEIVSFPARRKERSMSSLVVSTPSVSVRAGTRGRRTKDIADRIVKKKESSGGDDLRERRSSPATFDESTQNKSQSNSISYKENKDGDDANRTKPLKSSGHKRKCKYEDEMCDKTVSETIKPKRQRRTQRKRSATTFGDSGNGSRAKRERRNGPVWFSLVAQEGETYLPQIPPIFLRIRDGNIPVSFIQKYIMRKLNLESGTEIEIRCMGEVVIPTLKLDEQVNIWLQASSKQERFAASIGSSAKDYMMVLVYARKLPECNK